MCDEEIFEEEPLLTGPFINLSNFFLRNRQQYYNRLMRVSSEGEYLEWVKFFLKAVKIQSRHAIDTLEKVESLRKEYKESVDEEGVPGIAGEVIDELFRNPIITAPKVEKKFGKSYNTAYKTVKELEKRGILEEMRPDQRPKKYVCEEVLNVVYSDFEWTI
jgi:Fic family protein